LHLASLGPVYIKDAKGDSYVELRSLRTLQTSLFSIRRPSFDIQNVKKWNPSTFFNAKGKERLIL